MAVSFYLPKEINSVIEQVVLEGHTKSPNYISSNVVSPSILKRNLTKVQVLGVDTLNLNIVPLVLPTQHSTGNLLKARSFDYDFIVANTEAVADEPVFLVDIGSYSFQVTFETKTVAWIPVFDESTETSSNKVVSEYVYAVSEELLDDETGMDLSKRSFKATSFKNVEEVTIGAALGPVTLNVLKEYDLPVDNTVITFNDVTKKLTLTVTGPVSDVEDSNFKDITLLFGSGSGQSFTNLRLAGGITYQPVLDSFYTNTVITEDIPDMRDYLDSLNIKGYLGFFTYLKPYEGLLFNVEMGTTSEEEYDITSIPDVFKVSNISVFNDMSELFVGQSFIATATDIVKVSVSDTSEDSPVFFEGGTTKEWYDFFKAYGLHCRVLKEGGKVTKLYMNRIDNSLTNSNTIVKVFSPSPSTLEINPDFKTEAFNDLIGLNKHPEKLVTTSTNVVEDGKNVRSIVLGKSIRLKNSTSNCSYVGSKQIKAVKVSVNTANTLDAIDYPTGISVYSFTAEETPKLKAYGFEAFLTGLSTNLETNLDLQTVVDIDSGIVHVNNMTTLLDNLYVKLEYSDSIADPINYVMDSKDGPYSLIVDDNKSLISSSEAVVFLDHAKLEPLPTIVNDCSCVILDTSKFNELHVQPYAYRLLTDKVEEQDTYIFNGDNTLDGMFKSISPFFTSVHPLYVDGSVTDKVLVRIDSIAIDDKQMKNLLVWTNDSKDGLTEGYDTVYQIRSSFVNGAAVFTDVTPNLNSSVLFDGKYMTLNTKYGTSSSYATSATVNLPLQDSTFNVKIEDEDGLIEEQMFTVLSTNSLADIVSQSTLTRIKIEVASGYLKFSLNAGEAKQRLRVNITVNDSGMTVRNSSLVHVDEEDIVFILNKV